MFKKFIEHIWDNTSFNFFASQQKSEKKKKKKKNHSGSRDHEPDRKRHRRCSSNVDIF